MVFLIDISNLDSHLFEMLSQTSDNLYIYMADLEQDFFQMVQIKRGLF